MKKLKYLIFIILLGSCAGRDDSVLNSNSIKNNSSNSNSIEDNQNFSIDESDFSSNIHEDSSSNSVNDLFDSGWLPDIKPMRGEKYEIEKN